MASSIRTPAVRRLLRQPLSNPRFCQRRWAQVQDVRFLTTHWDQERILNKYKEKLQSKARAEGLGNVEQLKEAYKDKIERLRKEAAVPGATAPLAAGTASPSPSSSASSPWPSPPPPPTPQSSPASPPPPPGIKTLNSFLDLAKIAELPRKEIEALWRLRHVSNTQSVHFSLPAAVFKSLLSTANKHPAFVIPLPRIIPAEDAESPDATHQAAELHYLQFAHPHPHTTTLLFTSLAEFKLRGEFASPHSTITFHSELADSHDVVLGQGVVVENRGVSVAEAQWLVMCMQKFYVVADGGSARAELLEMFTRGDGDFNVDRLLEEAEKIV